ncbi:MAG: peptide-methionine (S)-S-oxide reductase [Planctomycetes bacterium]|nr:peptide-methionine (S)-S-oxide reductase [Planctomycetota bacterium]
MFLDSPVGGIEYETPTHSGITDADGHYDYEPGETVTFSLGDIVLGSVLAGPAIRTALASHQGAPVETVGAAVQRLAVEGVHHLPVIDELNAQATDRDAIVTTLEPLSEFHLAEAYHQDYVRRNPTNGYVRAVALPKVRKARKLFKDRLKAEKPKPTAP